MTDEGTSQATPSSSSHASPQHHGFDTTPTSQRFADNEEGSTSVFSSPDTSSTPRASRSNKSRPSIATYASPYEALRREVQGKGSEDDTPTSTLPSTPRGQTLSESTAESSPFLPPSTARQTRTPANDLLLHRVLDKNYRLQATPHTQARLPKSSTYNSNLRTPGTARRAHGRNANELDSSPLEEAPQLREELFGSPAKAKRVPGISVLTPARKTAQKDYQEDHEEKAKAKATVWDSDSDDDDLPEGMSPPKTMQFHIPQSKLLKTPGKKHPSMFPSILLMCTQAREASKRIVEDLLLTAGGNITESDDDSPSVVKRSGMREEDTF